MKNMLLARVKVGEHLSEKEEGPDFMIETEWSGINILKS